MGLGKEAPHAKPQLLAAAGEAFGFDVSPLQKVLALRNDGQQPEDLRGLYHAYMNAIQRVAHELDARAPKRHLQKMQ